MPASVVLPAHPDDGLLRRFLAGEAAACRTVESWARAVLLHQRLGLTAEDREDLVQEALTGVWQAAARRDFQLRYGLRAFVRHVAVVRAIDRRRRRRPVVELTDQLRDPATGPLENAAEREQRERLAGALEGLAPACRELIRLHFFEDWPYARIAEREGRREATMRVRMFHCIRALRRRLGGG